MSDAPRDARSFERIGSEDLRRIAEIGLAALADTCRPGNKSHAYVDRLELLCFCQGAALHHWQTQNAVPIEEQRGIHDFDVWGFFRSLPERHFANRTAQERDFGPSRFGKSPDDWRQGRKVDVMGRAIDFADGEGAIDAVRRWITSGPGKSPWLIRQRPVFVISEGPDFGRMIWSGA